MKKCILILAVLSMVGLLLLPMFSSSESPALERSVALRDALRRSKTVEVYEGLPHQMFERGLLEREMERDDVKQIDGFPFYTPAVAAEGRVLQELKVLISDEKTYLKYSGEKKCGGFHPDYTVQWRREENVYWVLICFGCEEVIFTDGGKSLKYDLNSDVKDKLRAPLAGFDKKRPRPVQTSE